VTEERRYLPDPSRLSVLMAIILLTFALTRVLNIPQGNISISLFGLLLTIPISLNTVISLLAAAITAAGMDWLLRTHPSLEKGETREHWLLPTLTVLALGITLNTLPAGVTWWLGFGLGALLLVLIFLAEYVVVDYTDARYQLATAVLTALAFAIFLLLVVSLKASNGRLFLALPALFLASFLVALRTLHLRLNERWEFAWAIGIGLVGMQLGAALHYWPLTPVRYGLALLAPVYALTALSVSLADGVPFRRAVAEPAVMLILLWGLLIWFR
jgi:Protein of unknown function (DUF5656)